MKKAQQKFKKLIKSPSFSLMDDMKEKMMKQYGLESIVNRENRKRKRMDSFLEKLTMVRKQTDSKSEMLANNSFEKSMEYDGSKSNIRKGEFEKQTSGNYLEWLVEFTRKYFYSKILNY